MFFASPPKAVAFRPRIQACMATCPTAVAFGVLILGLTVGNVSQVAEAQTAFTGVFTFGADGNVNSFA